jgi:hypothetical protein
MATLQFDPSRGMVVSRVILHRVNARKNADAPAQQGLPASCSAGTPSAAW